MSILKVIDGDNMNTKQLICVIAIIAILVISGCSTTTNSDKNVVNELPNETSEPVVENTTPNEVVEVNIINETTETSTPTQPEANESETPSNNSSTTTTGIVREIIIENNMGTPQDIKVKVGDILRFTSRQDKIRHMIVIRSLDSNTYHKLVAGPFPLLYNQSADYIFNESGPYDYFSSPVPDKLNGEIIVS
jgi:plastocyanin